jgi:uncharacterized protein (DUF2267 family)
MCAAGAHVMIGDLAVRVEGQRVSRECHGARMDYAEIIDKTGHAAGGLDREAAEHASRRRCRRWAERLPRDEARHIMRELPPELIPWIYTQTDAAAFGIDEFLEQVATREGTDIETAPRHARGVLRAGQRAQPSGGGSSGRQPAADLRSADGRGTAP